MEKGKSGGLDRRKFVVGAGAVVVGGVVGGVVGSQLFPREIEKIIETGRQVLPVALRPKYELRHDPTLCIGCRKCILACSLSKEGVCDLGLARLHLELKPFDTYPAMETCRQCQYPPCFYVCPWDAMSIDQQTGAKLVDESACQACGACVDACPYDIPFLYRDKSCICDLCGGDPMCVKACPTGALTYVEL